MADQPVEAATNSVPAEEPMDTTEAATTQTAEQVESVPQDSNTSENTESVAPEMETQDSTKNDKSEENTTQDASTPKEAEKMEKSDVPVADASTGEFMRKTFFCGSFLI